MYFCAAQGPLKEFANSVIELIQKDGVSLGISISMSSESDYDCDSNGSDSFFSYSDDLEGSYDSLDELTHVSTVKWTMGEQEGKEQEKANKNATTHSPPDAVEAARATAEPENETAEPAAIKLDDSAKPLHHGTYCMDLDLVGAQLFYSPALRDMLCANGGRLQVAVVDEDEARKPRDGQLVKPSTVTFLHKLLQIILAHH